MSCIVENHWRFQCFRLSCMRIKVAELSNIPRTFPSFALLRLLSGKFWYRWAFSYPTLLHLVFYPDLLYLVRRKSCPLHTDRTSGLRMHGQGCANKFSVMDKKHHLPTKMSSAWAKRIMFITHATLQHANTRNSNETERKLTEKKNNQGKYFSEIEILGLWCWVAEHEIACSADKIW